MVAITLSWLLFTGTYLALVGSIGLHEGAAAIVCGGLSALWVGQIGKSGDRPLRLRLTSLTPLLRACVELPGQTLRVGARLWRAAAKGDVSGESRPTPLHGVPKYPSGTDDPYAAGACALSVLAASLSADAYVLRLEPKRGLVLMHALLPDENGTRAG